MSDRSLLTSSSVSSEDAKVESKDRRAAAPSLDYAKSCVAPGAQGHNADPLSPVSEGACVGSSTFVVLRSVSWRCCDIGEFKLLHLLVTVPVDVGRTEVGVSVSLSVSVGVAVMSSVVRLATICAVRSSLIRHSPGHTRPLDPLFACKSDCALQGTSCRCRVGVCVWLELSLGAVRLPAFLPRTVVRACASWSEVAPVSPSSRGHERLSTSSDISDLTASLCLSSSFPTVANPPHLSPLLFLFSFSPSSLGLHTTLNPFASAVCWSVPVLPSPRCPRLQTRRSVRPRLAISIHRGPRRVKLLEMCRSTESLAKPSTSEALSERCELVDEVCSYGDGTGMVPSWLETSVMD